MTGKNIQDKQIVENFNKMRETVRTMSQNILYIQDSVNKLMINVNGIIIENEDLKRTKSSLKRMYF